MSEGDRLRAALLDTPAVPPNLVLNMIESLARIETQLGAVVVEQDRARDQRGKMFERFDETRDDIHNVDRRVDRVESAVEGVKIEVTTIKSDVSDHKALRQQATGGWSVIRALIVAGFTLFGGAIMYLLQHLLGR